MVEILDKTKGSIEVIVGPMYAGKSEELIRRINRAKIAEQEVVVFKPEIDNRYDKECVYSHNGNKVPAYAVRDEQEILNILKDKNFDVVAIDEVQFFSESIVGLCQELAQRGYRVICSGLDLDFRGEPFHPVPELMAIAEYVTKLTAVCMSCKMTATRTQRLINGRAAKYTDPIVLVGAKESYEARCRYCHEIRN